jgi:hypothetical protein
MSDSDLIIPSLPAISADGFFSVITVVPNSDSSFNTPNDTTKSNSYSYPLMDPAKLIGTGSQPYMPVALPAYISTLYENVFKINNNLTNDISTSANDDRTYPTAHAVQQYVQSQVAGSQIINGNLNTYTVVTTVNNTLITEIPTSAQAYSYTNNIVSQPGVKSISLFWMDTSPDAPRIGANKTVMFAAEDYLRDTSGNISGNLVFLYAGDNSHFIHMGKQYSYYQFVYRGDFVQFIQAYNGLQWDWLVTNSMGVFSNIIKVTSGGITKPVGSIQPSPVPDTIE